MKPNFDQHQFEALLDRHGAASADWPTEVRVQALELLKSSPEAQRLHAGAQRLDDVLDDILANVAPPLGLRTRIIANAPQRDAWLDWLTVRVWRPVALASLPLVLGFAFGANFADDTTDLEDQLLVAFADADSLEGFTLAEDI